MVEMKTRKHSLRIACLAAQLLLLFFAIGAQQNAVERGKFLLYKYQLQMGAETYEITEASGSLTLKTNFDLTFVGGRVPLATTLKVRSSDYRPILFESKGRTSTRTDVDASVQIDNDAAVIRTGSDSRTERTAGKFFTIAQPAPIAPQMMLFRYWRKNNVSGSLPILPGGSVKIISLGRDKISLNGTERSFDRYCIEGVMWGCETVWFDEKQDLIALIGADAEMDRFEAVRDGYESALPFFVKRAAEDAVRQMEILSDQIKPIRSGKYAIVGALLVDGRGGEPVSDSVVIVENGRILSAGTMRDTKIPANLPQVDARGKTLLPGLIDTHAHVTQSEWLPASFAAGVTTMRDAANELEFIVPLRDAIRSDRIKISPRLVLAGFIDSGPNALGKWKAETPDEARRIVNDYKRAGFEQIKIYNSLEPELVKVVTDEAHRLGMPVTGHIPRGLDIYSAVDNGYDQINHLNYAYRALLPRSWKPTAGVRPNYDPDSEAAQEGLRFLREHKTVIEPTLARGEVGSYIRNKPFAATEPGAAKIPYELKALIDSMGQAPQEGLEERLRQRDELTGRIILALHKNGIPLVVGTDLAIPGHTEFREIELLVRAGLTPMEAIQAATIVPARTMNLDKELGTIEAGKRADLILVDGNPLRAIREIRNVKFVIKDGRMYDTAPLWRSVYFLP